MFCLEQKKKQEVENHHSEGRAHLSQEQRHCHL